MSPHMAFANNLKNMPGLSSSVLAEQKRNVMGRRIKHPAAILFPHIQSSSLAHPNCGALEQLDHSEGKITQQAKSIGLELEQQSTRGAGSIIRPQPLVFSSDSSYSLTA